MKKLLAFAMAAMLLLPLTACAGRGDPPALEDVYDRLVEVIEEAHGVNFILFGPGLPTYPRDSAEAALLGVYSGTGTVSDTSVELVASQLSPYQTIEDMKAAIARVYSSSYCEALFESTFTGYAMSEGGNIVLPARFTEDQSGLYQNRYVDTFVSGQRTYDYASMEIVEGHATRIKVAIRSYANDAPGQWQDGDLDFVYENGNWYLDGPSC